MLYKLVLGPIPILRTNFQENPLTTLGIYRHFKIITGMFPTGDTSSGTLIAVCVSVCLCVCLSADISLYCAKNDSTDYPEIVWVCWV